MQISPGIAHPSSRLCLSDLRRSLPYKYWALVISATSPGCAASSASSSSGQRFASGFPQVRSRPRHPCRAASSSPCRASRGLSPPSRCALPGAQKKAAPKKGAAKKHHQYYGRLGESSRWWGLRPLALHDFDCLDRRKLFEAVAPKLDT